MAVLLPFLVYLPLFALAYVVLLGRLQSSGGLDLLHTQCTTSGRLELGHLPPFLHPLICFMRESMHRSIRYLVLDFITGLSAPFTIILLESMRYYGWLGIGAGFLVAMSSQIFGAGAVSPIYWLIYVVRFQPSAAKRPIKRRFVRSILGGIGVGMIAPTLAMLNWDESPNIHALWQVFPTVVAVIQVVFALFEASQYRNAQEEKEEEESMNDISFLVNFIYYTCAAAHIYSIIKIASGPAPIQALVETFLPSITLPTPSNEALKLRIIAHGFLKWDYPLTMLPSLIALVWTYEGSEVKWLSVIEDITLFGPGAAVIGLWGEREGIWKGKIHSD